MERFSARAFYFIGHTLAVLPSDITKDAKIADGTLDLAQPAIERTKQHAAAWLKQIGWWCKTIDLKFSCVHVTRVLEALDRNVSYAEIMNQLTELRRRITDEMQGQLFFFVPPEHAEFYGVQEPFGAEVVAAFPSTAFDIREAYNCYAFERPTASVFHLMRILEVSLVVLGKKFGLCFTHTNWGPAIEEIEKKIREMHKDPLWTVMPDWKDQLEFYAQTISYLGITKEAWRNYTAHARGKFTQEEAKVMLMNVKLFMRGVSQRLTE